MSERLEKLFARAPQGITRFVAYLMAGDPDYDTGLRRLKGLADNGVDILELGVPFSDPMADGPIIQAAGERALGAGMSLARVLEMVRDFRREHDTPLLLMSYLNPLFHYGWDAFVREAVASGVDGLILPDLPWREGQAFRDRAVQLVGRKLAFIPMIAQTSQEEDIRLLKEMEGGFAYVLSQNGITGEEAVLPAQVRLFIETLGESLRLPRCVGFGIQRREQVEHLAEVAEGVIVGSALVERLAALDRLRCTEAELPAKEKEVYTWLRTLWQR